MRFARNLLLAAAATSVAMACMATSAFAQSIEIHPEDVATHCSDVVVGASHDATGGCLVHAVSEDNAQTLTHNGISETVTSSCENEFRGRIGEDGTGYLLVDDDSIHTNPATGCVITACDEPGATGTHNELEWPISGLFETGGSREVMIVTFCIRPFNTAEGEGNTFCTIAVDIANDPVTHEQEFTANEEPCFETPALELTGHWLTEAVNQGNEVDIEAEHIHYP
jgi:hypothetical protein